MNSFPAPARAMVAQMAEAAAADPARAIAYQGSPGANSHRAAVEMVPGCLPLPCFSFADAIEAVKDGRAGAAAIPIENSQHGRVADIHFLLPESGLSIVAEHFLRINHALMAAPTADGQHGPFEYALSHPQALGQSRHYLQKRGIKPQAHSDTAGAAAYVAEMCDPTLAAIAPPMAADLYGLDIVENDVEDAADNTTRFLLLAREPLPPETVAGRPAITTFVFEVKNIPAALYKALGGFATNGVNMTKLESYQIGARFAASMFYSDILGAPGDPAVDRALDELAYHSKELRILGTYPQARERG
ncbi:prephenate dehydratase [Altererythrobacter sp. FM1]|uniref:prephenate dehydratase n=1 Tax=Tsuneonella flava TaxID=2055955 RepID=A0ABX7KA34_9SPHN|nr:prephenate dehydratase [Tsuneonella flava]QSB44382.1 prephenate dehydratase [Tsuneonella flava]ROT94091.1 prephenate dehydratase [Altererythrobacter sp. FM1]